MKKLWILFTVVIVASFTILGIVGGKIWQKMPPIPKQVVATDGSVLISEGEIMAGQNVWQAMGGMQVGSIWGHGSYVAPDWTADWLHRECRFILDLWAQEAAKKPFDALSAEAQAPLRARLKGLMRANTYDPATGRLTLDAARVKAFEANASHFADVFSKGHAEYAIPAGAQKDPAKLRRLAYFFFWTSWAASTQRPGESVTYTQNWPHEDLVENHASGQTVVWTGVSIIMLLAGIAALAWFFAAKRKEEGGPAPTRDPLLGLALFPSQRAVLKYFAVVSLLFLVQILAGVVTAHYGVEGGGFYGVPIDKWIPYVITRTWHVQIGILWIATAWLAAGLFIGPVVSGEEPKGQLLGVNLLFGALLVVVAGSLAGQWLSVMNKFVGENTWFWLGHQGWEYVELGRVWQLGLFVGLLLWLFLVVRGVAPAFKKPGDHKSLLALFLVSATAIGLFYGAGLAWGPKTHLSLVEYWRWWVVHLWVEGFFEVFATVVIAFFFMRIGLIKPLFAATASLLSATIYLAGGIIGTLHHLYFSGTPTTALAFGSVFSALEVVPLVLTAFHAMDDYRLSKAAPWVRAYRWPIFFFLAVAFWNAVGAGLFGFMINPPIALYYMQGLNTTPLHGHTALFGVYGMLGLGLMLFVMRAADPERRWNERVLAFSFWSLNIGLLAMALLSLLPVGLMQTWASVDSGYWYARSGEFLKTPVMMFFKWMRVPGDTLFGLGALVLSAYVLFGLLPGLGKKKTP